MLLLDVARVPEVAADFFFRTLGRMSISNVVAQRLDILLAFDGGKLTYLSPVWFEACL